MVRWYQGDTIARSWSLRGISPRVWQGTIARALPKGVMAGERLLDGVH